MFHVKSMGIKRVKKQYYTTEVISNKLNEMKNELDTSETDILNQILEHYFVEYDFFKEIKSNLDNPKVETIEINTELYTIGKESQILRTYISKEEKMYPASITSIRCYEDEDGHYNEDEEYVYNYTFKSVEEFFEKLNINHSNSSNIWISKKEGMDILTEEKNPVISLDESFEYKRPKSFEIERKEFEVSQWKEVLIKTYEYLFEKNPEIFNKIKIGKNPLIYFSEKGLNNPRFSQNLGGYIETNFSADRIRDIIKRILKEYRISKDEFKIRIE